MQVHWVGKGLSLQTKYDLAISSARKVGLIQDAALAAQLAAEALHNADETRNYSGSCLLQAHDLWLSWGANAIALKVAQDHPELDFLSNIAGTRHFNQERGEIRSCFSRKSHEET